MKAMLEGAELTSTCCL